MTCEIIDWRICGPLAPTCLVSVLHLAPTFYEHVVVRKAPLGQAYGPFS